MKQFSGPNLAASIHDRLLNLARQRREEFQFVLTSYVIERLLYRLSQSTFRDRFILKGAILFALWSGYPRRATWDVDLLGRGSPSPQDLVTIFRSLLALEVESDGLLFPLDAIETTIIQKDGQYHGVRVRILARLGQARVQLHVDVGYGDAIHPPPTEQVFPTLLSMPAPLLKAYPREVVVAEKLHAMLTLGMANSRLKDYYDIWSLARHGAFEEATLGEAIRSTLERRHTPLPAHLPPAMGTEFALSLVKQKQWQGFLRRARVQAVPSLDEAVTQLEAFLWPILQRLGMEDALQRHWPAGGPWQDDGQAPGLPHPSEAE